MKKIIFVFIIFSNICFSQSWIKIEYLYQPIAHSSANDTLKSVLISNGIESVFKLNDNRKKGLDTEANRLVHTDSLSNFTYTNSDQSFSRIILYNQEFVYSDSVYNKINWKITPNKKKIGIYNCQEAKTNLNGRDYSAWYTTQIPINFGPLKLHGLPGMVVEASESTGQVFKISLGKITYVDENKDFQFHKNYFINNKKLINYKKYCQVMTDAMIYRKTRFYIVGAERNVTFTFGKGAFVKEMIDIPEKLEEKLEAITQ